MLLRRAWNPLDWLRPWRLFRSAKTGLSHETPVYYKATANGNFLELSDASGNAMKVRKPQEQWTGRLWNLVSALQDEKGESDQVVRILGPYGTLHACCFSHNAVMLIGAGVGYPSMGSLLRQILEDNLKAESSSKRHVCFMWTCRKVDQLHLCFPSLLADLTKYVHRSSLADLQQWLTVKIFVGDVGQDDVLAVEPDATIGKDMTRAFNEVKGWLLRPPGSSSYDEDGTYVAKGSLGACFSDILTCSLFIRNKVLKEGRSLGICFCGPLGLCSWLRNDIECTTVPWTYEFASEVAGS